MNRLSELDYIALEDQYNAHNYKPLDVVIAKAEAPLVWDVEGEKDLDCLSAYWAVNQVYPHPRVVQTMIDQAQGLALTSRAFRNDQLPLLARELCELNGYQKMLPMESGTEAVETALKAALETTSPGLLASGSYARRTYSGRLG